MKPAGPGAFLWGHSVIAFSILSMGIGLFILSISTGVIFGKLHLSEKLSILSI